MVRYIVNKYTPHYTSGAHTHQLISPRNNNSRLYLIIMRAYIRVAESTSIRARALRDIRPVLLCARRGNVGIIREGRPTKAALCQTAGIVWRTT